MFEYFVLTTRIINHMNHKLLSPALGYHKQTEIVLFNLLMITRHFPHIPVLDVNSFSKKVTGPNQRAMSCDEGEFPVCLYTTKSTLSMEQVMWLEVLKFFCFVENTHVVIQHIQEAYATIIQFLLFPLYIAHPLSNKLSWPVQFQLSNP